MKDSQLLRRWIFATAASGGAATVTLCVAAILPGHDAGLTAIGITLGGIAAIFALVSGKHLTSVIKEAETANTRAELLQRQILRQREVVDALADGLDVSIFLCDAKGTVEYANKTAATLFRFREPHNRSILALTVSADLQRIVEAAAIQPRRIEEDVLLRVPEERFGIAQAWADPKDSERIFLTIFETTNLRRMERARKDFVANVSHELRTPLTTIRAMSETLLDSTSEERDSLAPRYLGKIVHEVDRLTEIAQDLLTLSIAESTELEKSPVNFTEIVREAFENLQKRAASKDLLLEMGEMEPIELVVNENQMSQVATNIIINAIKYTDSGGVKVEVRRANGGAELTVTDTGIGIPMEDQSRIFERFYRVDKGRSRASGSTGLGLSIVKHIVEAHGGRVSVESTLHIGSVFKVWLPELPLANPKVNSGPSLD